MKVIEIAGNNYTLEFSIEASLYSDCTEKIMTLMSSMDGKNAKAVVSGMANIPSTVVSLLHAGLLEHHNIENEKVTKGLLKLYLNEHKDDEKGNFYALMEELIDCMADDGFFKLIGLEAMTEKATKEVKKPQDHKKATKVSEK